MCHWPKCYHVLNWFCLPKPGFFGIYLSFQRHKSLLNQYLSHSKSKSYQINSIRSGSLRSFQQHQRHIPIPKKLLATIEFNFQWRKYSIFKNFYIASPNAMEPSPCTPPCWDLPKDSKNMIWSISVQWVSYLQNKLHSFIDRWLCTTWAGLGPKLCMITT